MVIKESGKRGVVEGKGGKHNLVDFVIDWQHHFKKRHGTARVKVWRGKEGVE